MIEKNKFMPGIWSVLLVSAVLVTSTAAYGGDKARTRDKGHESETAEHEGDRARSKDEGHESETQHHEVKVTNLHGNSLTNIEIKISGTDSGDFSQTNDCKGKLGKGKSCKIDVTFAPKTTGSKSATLVVLTPDGEQSVVLTGTGVAITADNE